MRLQQTQKQRMSFTKKAAMIGGASLVIALIAFVGIKLTSVEDSTAGSTFTWTGKVNSDWNNKRNWSGNKKPQKGSDILIEKYTNAPEISRNSNFSIEDLSLTESAQLTIDANLDVKGDINLGDDCKIISKKGKLKVDGSLILNGEDANFINRGADITIDKNLLLVSKNDADSTYLKNGGGSLEIKGATYFLRNNSSTDAFVSVKGGSVELNETEKDFSGYDNGRIVYLVAGGEVDFYKNLIMENNSSSSSFTFKASSPCDDATAWDSKTTYNRIQTQRIYVSHKSDVYRMKANKTWSKGDEPGKGKGKSIWEKIKCEDYCDLADAWESNTQYKRNNGGDEVYVEYKGTVYELANNVWWSQNHQPDNSSSYWTKVKKCSEYSAPSCGSVQQWNSSIAYRRNSKSDIIEVFWEGKVYLMKTNKWYSKNDEPGKNGKIWQYNRKCKGGSSSSASIGSDSLKHAGGVITFHKKWSRPAGFESSNNGTIKFNSKNEKLKLQANDKFINLEVKEGVELDVEGNVFVLGSLKVNGTCSGNSVINLNGLTKQEISGSGAIANITLNNSSDVELQGDITISGELKLTKGDIELGDNDITLTGTITHGNANSYLKINGDGVVKAEVGDDPVIFPVGRNPYEPIVIDDGGGALYEVGVRDDVYENPEDLSNEITTESVSETWYVKADEAKSNVSITLGWDPDQELSGFTRSQSFVAYWEEGVSSAWTPSSTGAASGDGPYYRNVVMSNMSTNRYYFGVGSGNSALPVEFTYFNAIKLSNAVELKWGTATETNNEKFEVQRSADGVIWEVIDEVKGEGTTLEAQDYIAYDNNPLNGLTYYRLKQIDFDGKFDYSKTVTVTFGANAHSTLEISSVYPNPFSSFITVELMTSASNDIQVDLISANGNVLRSQSFNQYDELRLSGLDALQKGIYIIRVSSGDETVSKQILKR